MSEKEALPIDDKELVSKDDESSVRTNHESAIISSAATATLTAVGAVGGEVTIAEGAAASTSNDRRKEEEEESVIPCVLSQRKKQRLDGGSSSETRSEDAATITASGQGAQIPAAPRPSSSGTSTKTRTSIDGTGHAPAGIKITPVADDSKDGASSTTIADNINDKPPAATTTNTPASASTSGPTTTSRDYYFDSYAHHGIHEEMLKDQVRTQTYQNAILQNPHLFRDKIVLDVGCGTGILSMFAAQAGARHVYAIDCSNILDRAKEIVQRNGFADKITLLKGKVEDVALPHLAEKTADREPAPHTMKDGDELRRVDVIISEWMGYFLLYESMLDTVLFARDKWLVPTGGIVFPDKAIMYLCAAEDGPVKAERIDFWNDVYGFDMTPLRDVAMREPVVDVVEPKQIVTDAVPIYSVDLLTCARSEELSFRSSFKLTARRDDYLHGLVAYFECAFTQVHKPIGFSTSPSAQYTHWKQTVFYLEDAIAICCGETMAGTIECHPNPSNGRDLDISLTFEVDGRHTKLKNSMLYHLR